MPFDLAKPHDQSIMWIYGLKLIKLSHHPSKYGGHRHCGSGDIMILVFYKNTWWKDHVTFWAGPHWGMLRSCSVWWPPTLWYWRYNDCSLPRDLTNHVIRGSCDLIICHSMSVDHTSLRDQIVMWRNLQECIKVSYHLEKFGDTGIEDMFLVCHLNLT